MKTRLLPAIAALTSFMCVACDERSQPQPAPDTRTVDAWLGRWNGPEGTFLEISPAGESYSIKIQNLDGPSTYAGNLRDGRLTFERSGKIETISATDGKGTGMKWLLDKRDCLVVNVGEGFCRD